MGGLPPGATRNTGRLAAFVYAVEHLEIGGLELLRRVAARAGDEQTLEVVDRAIAQERSAAARGRGRVRSRGRHRSLRRE
jgi:ferritin-like metal-binding protein YciE